MQSLLPVTYYEEPAVSMKTSFLLRECAVAESDEVREGVIIDYDESGMACAIEILDASEKVSNPDGIAYEMKAKRT
jgi:uncharacterized protein YuzE